MHLVGKWQRHWGRMSFKRATWCSFVCWKCFSTSIRYNSSLNWCQFDVFCNELLILHLCKIFHHLDREADFVWYDDTLEKVSQKLFAALIDDISLSHCPHSSLSPCWQDQPVCQVLDCVVVWLGLLCQPHGNTGVPRTAVGVWYMWFDAIVTERPKYKKRNFKKNLVILHRWNHDCINFWFEQKDLSLKF